LTKYSSSQEDIVASLEAYITLLAARNNALSRISDASNDIKSTLKTSDSPNISKALQRRKCDITNYASLCADKEHDRSILAMATELTKTANNELSELARKVIDLREDSRLLAEEVLECQDECKTLLKSRVEATSGAIRRSTQRRKLDAAYGPSIDHHIPTFMDRQR